MLANTGPGCKQARPLEVKDKMDSCSSGYGVCLQDGTEGFFFIYLFPGVLGES